MIVQTRRRFGAASAAGTALAVLTAVFTVAPAQAAPGPASAAPAHVEAAERVLGLTDDRIPDRVRAVGTGASVTVGERSKPIPVKTGGSVEGDRFDGDLEYTVDQLTTDTTRLSAVLTSRDAGTPRWTFPADTELTVLVDGRVSVADGDGELLAGIDAPWAVDAAGRQLRTHYEVDGPELSQVIDTDADTVFPVVADPKFAQYVGYWTVTLNRAESATAVGTVASCAALFSKSPVPALRVMTVACGALAAFSGAQLAGGKCVRVHVVGIPPTLGTWWPTFPKC